MSINTLHKGDDDDDDDNNNNKFIARIFTFFGMLTLSLGVKGSPCFEEF
jgi:hypothetical protein